MMTSNQALKPIAIFDSGVGGLTVAKALRKKLPCESFLYLADTASRPFGMKTKEQLEEILKKNAQILLDFQIKMVVIACHTACSCGLTAFSSLNVPIMGISSSSFTTLNSLPSSSPFIILGTQRTICSGIYQEFIKNLDHPAPSFFLPCSPIEKLIESFCLDDSLIEKEITFLLSSVSTIQQAQVLLACTHFPIYKKYIQKALDSSAILLDPAENFAEKIKDELIKLNLLSSNKEPTNHYLITDDLESFKKKFFYYFQDSLVKTKSFFNQSYAMI